MQVPRLEVWQLFWTRRYLWDKKSQAGKVEQQAGGAWGIDYLMESHNILGFPISRLVLSEREMNLYSCLSWILGIWGCTQSNLIHMDIAVSSHHPPGILSACSPICRPLNISSFLTPRAGTHGKHFSVWNTLAHSSTWRTPTHPSRQLECSCLGSCPGFQGYTAIKVIPPSEF